MALDSISMGKTVVGDYVSIVARGEVLDKATIKVRLSPILVAPSTALATSAQRSTAALTGYALNHVVKYSKAVYSQPIITLVEKFVC